MFCFMNKNQYISNIKKIVSGFDKKTYNFKPNTIMLSWYDGEKIKTTIYKVFVKNNVLYINCTDEHHTDINNTEKMCEWDVDDVAYIYKLIESNVALMPKSL